MAPSRILGRPLASPPASICVLRTQMGYVCVPATRQFSSQTHTPQAHSSRRRIQTSSSRPSSTTYDPLAISAVSPNALHEASSSEDMAPPRMKLPPLSVMPLSTIVRNLATTSISSSPALLPLSLAIMSVLAHTTNPLLNPDRNPVLGFLLKKTFYAQFCAGENAAEVRKTVNDLKTMGFKGVMLCYAREVVLSEKQTTELSDSLFGNTREAEECVRSEVTPWAQGTMETIRLAQKGDFVSVKFSGAGRQALWALKERLLPSGALKDAIEKICKLAQDRDIPLTIDAEQTAIQGGIDAWTMDLQCRYNTTPGHAIIYNTYQAYLKSTPATLTRHLKMANDAGFTLGAKLVRGAYLGSDPRHIIHDTKEDTDRHHDSIAASLIQRTWGSILRPVGGDAAEKTSSFPRVSLVLGTHNIDSVRQARAINNALPESPLNPELAIAQLQGMADEVSCELVLGSEDGAGSQKKAAERAGAYKYLVWGTTGECMKYLLRRAHENRDAVARTRAGRDAMFAELKRRMWTVIAGRA